MIRPPTKANVRDANKRRKKIATLIKEIGLYNIEYTSLAREHNCSEKTIRKDVEKLLEHMDIIDAEKVKFELSRGYEQIIGLSRQHLASKEPDYVKVKWAGILLKAMESQTRFLEDWGAKTQHTNRTEVTITHDTFAEAFKKYAEEEA